jgi:hypothetical protein
MAKDATLGGKGNWSPVAVLVLPILRDSILLNANETSWGDVLVLQVTVPQQLSW